MMKKRKKIQKREKREKRRKKRTLWFCCSTVRYLAVTICGYPYIGATFLSDACRPIPERSLG